MKFYLCVVGLLEREVLERRFFYEWLEGIGLTKVQLDRVNFKPNSTHSTRESEWTKVWAIFNLHTC